MDYQIKQIQKHVQRQYSRSRTLRKKLEVQGAFSFPYHIICFGLLTLLLITYYIKGLVRDANPNSSIRPRPRFVFPPEYLEQIKNLIKKPIPIPIPDPDLDVNGTGKHTVVRRDVYNHQKYPDGFFLQYGFYDKHELPCTKMLERDAGFSGIIIEPDPERYKELVNEHRKALVMNACLSTDKGQRHANKTLTRRGRMAPEKELDLPQEFTAECFPLYDILYVLGKSERMIDFLQVDAKGEEFETFAAIPWRYIRVKVISVQVPHEDKERMDALMKENNFKIGSDYDGNLEVYYVNNNPHLPASVAL